MSPKLPGRTSVIELPSGRMSLQTEAYLESEQIVSILVYQGRVLKRRSTALPRVEQSQRGRTIDAAHGAFERDIRAALERAALARATACVPASAQETVSLLFMMAIEAYVAADLETARLILETLVVLAPADRRIAEALQGVNDECVSTTKP